jgi:hypothetical protein
MTGFRFGALDRKNGLLIGQVSGARLERENRSENYVEIPPALLITDECGGMWTLGTEYVLHPGPNGGQYEWNVLRNDVDIGEMASRIVYHGRRVTIYGRDGRRVWNGRAFV